MEEILNISMYKFNPITDMPALRDRVLAFSLERGLKGTVLISPEGLNVFVAGQRKPVEELVELLRSIPGFEDLKPKESISDRQPFKRMLVKLKKEIIAFGVEGIDPARYTAPKLPPKTLKQWLDEGKPITLLDARNEYEMRTGTFRGALNPKINHFRDFPKAVEQLPEALKDQPVVMFCTGGIRCEKAGPFMQKQGFKQIYQLEGGILKYFEECGGAHYDGECFVFDRRVGVDPQLKETESILCYCCQMPLTIEDQKSPDYVFEKSCPFCINGKPAKKQTVDAG